MSRVTPLAREVYDRKEEQNFREFVRRNLAEVESKMTFMTEKLRFANLPVYADDAAAGAGGLVQSQFYRTAAGALMVKL